MEPKFKNVIFDCDSTLTRIEGLDEIARRKGMLNRVELITQQGMNGEIPYRVSFQKRWLEIVRPSKKDLEWLGELYVQNLIEDALRVVSKLMSMGRNVFILSHVPEVSINILAKSLGLPPENVFAVPVKFRQDSLMSIPEAFLEVIEDFKVQVIKKVRTYGSTVLVGDGITDYTAGKEADLFIGFGGVTKRPKVKELSQVYIEEPRLQPVVDIVL